MKIDREQLAAENAATVKNANSVLSLDELLDLSPSPDANSAPSVPLISGVVIGELVGFAADDCPLIDFSDNPTRAPLAARSTVVLSAADIGKRLVMQFERGEVGKPIVVGLLHVPSKPETGVKANEVRHIQVDDDHLVITAERQITLRCGKSSITLTRAGKVLIRGEYVLSRASGANQIQGGSVQLN